MGDEELFRRRQQGGSRADEPAQRGGHLQGCRKEYDRPNPHHAVLRAVVMEAALQQTKAKTGGNHTRYIGLRPPTIINEI